MRIIVLGQGRHGKDTFCEIARDIFGLTFKSSSEFALDEFIYEKMKANYKSKEECYADRHNNRKIWYDLIVDYNKNNKTRLAKGIFSKYNIYCGMRDLEEFKSSKDLADIIIYVDAYDRLGNTEGLDSNNIKKDFADVVITNNGSLEDFKKKVVKLLKLHYCCGNWNNDGVCSC